MSTYYWMSCEDCKKQTEDTIIIQRLSGECLDNTEVLLRFLMNHQYHNLQLFSEHDEIRSEYPADRRETNDIQK